MKRTTIMLPDDVEATLRYKARQRGVSMAVVAREILEDALAPPPGGNRLSFIGMIDDRSLPDDLATNFDHYLGEALEREHQEIRSDLLADSRR